MATGATAGACTASILSQAVSAAKRKRDSGESAAQGQLLDNAERTCCPWEGPYADLEKHLARCEHVRVPCPHIGCNVRRTKRRDLESHKRRCRYKSVQCSLCMVCYPLNEEEEHIGKLCTHRLLQCPLQCGKSVQYFKLMTHLTDFCPHQQVPCLYAAFGTTRNSSSDDGLLLQLIHSSSSPKY